MIIVEGPDCAGKTTLVRRLWEARPYYHQGPYASDNIILETMQQLTSKTITAETVCDRLHIGERVYGPIYRGRDNLGPVRQDVIDQLLLNLWPTALIICLPPWEAVREAFVARQHDEMFGDQGVTALRKQWQGFALVTSRLPTFYYDWTSLQPEDVALEVDKLGA